MLREARKKSAGDANAVAAAFLGVDVEDALEISHDVPMTDSDAVRLEFARQIGLLDSPVTRAATPSEPATWSTVSVGDVRLRVPEYVSVPFPEGVVAPVPLFVRGWPKQNGWMYHLRVFGRREDVTEMEAYLADLVAAGRGPRSPYYRRLVQVSAAGSGPQFTVVELEALTRDQLILPDDVWDAVGRNIDRMFERMDRLEAARLGTNRGLVLAGPPGTGKSALRRALALEYVGKATVTIMSASAGQHQLAQVYERLNDLGPALVLIEDLDLLVGDREEHERSPLVQFLTVLDGLMTRHSRIVTIATTNDAEMIDDAALRAARFDQVIVISMPDETRRAAILAMYLAPLAHEGVVEELARQSAGFSGADLREVVRAAVLDSESDVITHEELVDSVRRRRGALDTTVSMGFMAG